MDLNMMGKEGIVKACADQAEIHGTLRGNKAFMGRLVGYNNDALAINDGGEIVVISFHEIVWWDTTGN